MLPRPGARIPLLCVDKILRASRCLLFTHAFALAVLAAPQPTPSGLKPPFAYPPCDPVASDVIFGHDASDAVSAKLTILFEQDEAREKNAPNAAVSGEASRVYWEKVSIEDHRRQAEVMGFLQKGELNSADDLYHAAMIFQHGNCPEHFKLANLLAEKAMDRGSDAAKWLYAATLDRYLMSQEKPQKFGTQFVTAGDTGTWKLYDCDPTTTDEERARYKVPSLAIQKQKLEKLNSPENKGAPLK